MEEEVRFRSGSVFSDRKVHDVDASVIDANGVERNITIGGATSDSDEKSLMQAIRIFEMLQQTQQSQGVPVMIDPNN